jgi:hypothetical protein
MTFTPRASRALEAELNASVHGVRGPCRAPPHWDLREDARSRRCTQRCPERGLAAFAGPRLRQFRMGTRCTQHPPVCGRIRHPHKLRRTVGHVRQLPVDGFDDVAGVDGAGNAAECVDGLWQAREKEVGGSGGSLEPCVSFYVPPHRLYAVVCVPSYPLEPPG